MDDKLKHFYEFEDFRLDADNPALWRGDQFVQIPPKALETLILLVRHNGDVVSRDVLLDTVWKDTFVEEGNINYTISLLRKVLGNKELIQTVPHRGYRFVADVKSSSSNGKNREAVVTPPATREFRWILTSVALISMVFLTSFALWWGGEKGVVSAETARRPNEDAVELYTRGKTILTRKNVDNREEKALDEFQQAISLDPTFAAAYAGLAETYSAMAVKASGQSGRDRYQKAKVAAERALDLDPNLPEGLLVRGWLKRNADWDWEGAETDLRRAVRIEPRNPIGHYRLSYVLSSTGRHDEALAEITTAYQLDPVSDTIASGRFPILEARGDYDDALRLAEAYLNENKNNSFAARAAATFLYHKGDYPAVIEMAEKSLASEGGKTSFAWLSLLAAAYHQTGQIERSDEIIDQLQILARNDSKAMYSLAMNYAERGRHDDAIQALQKCLATHEERMVWLKGEPRFANLRNDPRFNELIRAVNLG